MGLGVKAAKTNRTMDTIRLSIRITIRVTKGGDAQFQSPSQNLKP